MSSGTLARETMPMERPRPNRLRRLTLGVSLVEVSAAIGVDPATLSHVERGRRVRPDVEAKLDHYLTERETRTRAKARPA